MNRLDERLNLLLDRLEHECKRAERERCARILLDEALASCGPISVALAVERMLADDEGIEYA